MLCTLLCAVLFCSWAQHLLAASALLSPSLLWFLVLLTGKSHEQRSLVGYSPRGCKESDTTEHTHTLQIPIPGFIVGILSIPRSPTLQTPPSMPVFMCCTRQETSAAFSPSLNFHNSQRRFYYPYYSWGNRLISCNHPQGPRKPEIGIQGWLASELVLFILFLLILIGG